MGMSQPEGGGGLERGGLCRGVSSTGLAGCFLGPFMRMSVDLGSDCDSQSQIPSSFVFFVLVIEDFRGKSPFEIVYLKARSLNLLLRVAGRCRETFFCWAFLRSKWICK